MFSQDTHLVHLIYMSTQRKVFEGQTGIHRAKRASFARGVRAPPDICQKPRSYIANGAISVYTGQLRYPSKISLPILIQICIFSLVPVVFSLGAPASHIPRMWKTAPEIIRIAYGKLCARRFNDLIWEPLVRVEVEP